MIPITGETICVGRLNICPGLAGTVSVLRPCPGVPAGWWKCPGFLFAKITRKFAKTVGRWSEDLFFWRAFEKPCKNYDCPGSLSEKYGNPVYRVFNFFNF